MLVLDTARAGFERREMPLGLLLLLLLLLPAAAVVA